MTIRDSVVPEAETLAPPEGLEMAAVTAAAAKRWQGAARKTARRGSAPSLLSVARDKSDDGPRNNGVVGVS